MKTKKVVLLLNIFIGLILLQFSRIMFNYIIFLFIEKTDFSDHMVTAIFMALFSAVMIAWTRKKDILLSVFPKGHTIFYTIATVFVVALLVSTPFITGDHSISTIALIVYSSIITPMFEELLFRGLIWNKLAVQFKKTISVYIISTLIFAVWHLGYVDSVMFRMSLSSTTGLANAMLWKVITGLCFGIVLGAIRYKTKNCYSTMLLHGIMNLFGR